MTLKNRHLYLGVIVTAITVIGLSGITEADAIFLPDLKFPFGIAIQNYKTCVETDKSHWLGGANLVKKNMHVKSTFWEQNSNYPHFKLGYNFPATISDIVLISIHPTIKTECKVTKELVRIDIMVQAESDDTGKVYTCYNRGYLNGHDSYDNPTVDEDNSLTNKEDGFPKTSKFTKLKCNYQNFANDIGDENFVGVRAIYDNLETGKEQTYRLDHYYTIVK